MSLRITTNKALLWLAVLDILAAAGVAYAFWELQALNASLAEKTREVDGYAATDASLTSLQATLNQTEEDVRMIDSYFIPSDGVAEFVGLVESMARENGLKAETRSLEAQDVDKSTRTLFERVVVRLETQGGWTDTYRFMGLVENLPYKVVFEGAGLELVDDGPQARGRAYWEGNFVITAYKLK